MGPKSNYYFTVIQLVLKSWRKIEVRIIGKMQPNLGGRAIKAGNYFGNGEALPNKKLQ